ncbi:unnamed protein product [Prorocentrum cordatum]|uniref:Uncharacterized protein n=1 Tax=Prorocentrum cordatum TaxID=2364126 RepID=A0ABN9SM80_9DINO|nr:unnamed protein product [Polarella glacialis]
MESLVGWREGLGADKPSRAVLCTAASVWARQRVGPNVLGSCAAVRLLPRHGSAEGSATGSGGTKYVAVAVVSELLSWSLRAAEQGRGFCVHAFLTLRSSSA